MKYKTNTLSRRNMILSWVIKSKEEVRLRNYCNFFGYLGEKSENAMLYKLLDCNRNNKKPFVGICKWNYSISTRMKKYKKKNTRLALLHGIGYNDIHTGAI